MLRDAGQPRQPPSQRIVRASLRVGIRLDLAKSSHGCPWPSMPTLLPCSRKIGHQQTCWNAGKDNRQGLTPGLTPGPLAFRRLNAPLQVQDAIFIAHAVKWVVANQPCAIEIRKVRLLGDNTPCGNQHAAFEHASGHRPKAESFCAAQHPQSRCEAAAFRQLDVQPGKATGHPLDIFQHHAAFVCEDRQR